MDTTIDRDALRAKYGAERDKRLRADGNDAVRRADRPVRPLPRRPYAERVEREPLFDEVTVAFIGGGFAGLVTGARLKQAGIDDVRIIEKGGDVGGTWYWNRYPGAQCDTAALIYLPLLEETGHMPTEKYTHAPEILEHCQRIADALRPLRQRAASRPRSPPSSGTTDVHRWIIRTDRGDEMRAKFVAMGTGPLHRPKLPGHPRASRRSPATASTPAGGTTTTPAATRPARRSTGSADKRVGIIGTGATVGAVHPAPRPRRRRAVRVPAHAVVDRRPQQPPDRPRLVRHARAGLAGRSG